MTVIGSLFIPSSQVRWPITRCRALTLPDPNSRILEATRQRECLIDMPPHRYVADRVAPVDEALLRLAVQRLEPGRDVREAVRFGRIADGRRERVVRDRR